MNESPEGPTRRRFLAASAVGLAGVASTVGLAGCTGRGGGSDDGGAGGSGGSGGTSGGDTTPTPTPAGLRLDTLSVGGSPGETTVVKPAGEVALLDFFATWCAPCKPQMGELGTVREQNPDLHMLSLTREKETQAVESFWTEFEGTWPVAQDTKLEAFQEYGIKRIPTLLVLDAEGSEVWRHSGLAAADDILANIEEARA